MKLFFRFLLSLTVLLGGFSPSHAFKQQQLPFHQTKESLQAANLQLADVYAASHLVIKYLPKSPEEKYSPLVARDNEDQQEEEDEDHKLVTAKKHVASDFYCYSGYHSQSADFVCRHSKVYPPLCKSLAYSSAPRYLLLGVFRI